MIGYLFFYDFCQVIYTFRKLRHSFRLTNLLFFSFLITWGNFGVIHVKTLNKSTMYLLSILLILMIGLVIYNQTHSIPELPQKSHTSILHQGTQTRSAQTPNSKHRAKQPHRGRQYFKKKKERNRIRNKMARKSRQINRRIKA